MTIGKRSCRWIGRRVMPATEQMSYFMSKRITCSCIITSYNAKSISFRNTNSLGYTNNVLIIIV